MGVWEIASLGPKEPGETIVAMSGELRDAKSIFDPTLFWDAREIDIRRHAEYVIARVLDFGDEKDVKKLREMYSDANLIQSCCLMEKFRIGRGSSDFSKTT